MRNPLASLYEQVLINEAEKSGLQSPSNDKVGSVKGGQELFDSKPDPKKVDPESNKDSKVGSAKNLDHKLTSPEDPEGEEDKNADVKKGNLKSSVPAKSSEEIEGSKPKPKGLGEEVTMGAFETLFRKTLVTEEEGEDMDMNFEAGEEAPEGSEEHEASETEAEESMEEEESDLLSDLQDLQVRITDIITKLEKAVEDESGEGMEDQSYDEEDFDQEFGEEEAPESEESEEEVKTESVKNKSGLLGTNNKVGGKLKAKKGKANTGKFETKAEIKVLGDKKKTLQKGNVVKSSVKGDLFK